MVISFSRDNRIIALVILLFVVQRFFLSEEQFIVLLLIIIFLLTIKYRKIIIPRIAGLHIYIAVLVLITIIGLTKYSFFSVQRDIFYQVWPILIMIVGYLMFFIYGDKDKSLWETIVLVMFILAIVSLLQASTVKVSEASFGTFRNTFGDGTRSTSILLPLLIAKRFVLKEKTLSPKIDIIAMIVWIIQITLNFSRTSLFNSGLGLIICIVCLIAKKQLSLATAGKTIILVGTLIAIIAVIYVQLPKKVLDRFEGKVETSLTEISYENKYNSSTEAQKNWRGYEIVSAQKEWRESDLFTQIFGKGNGSLIHIKYIPYKWKDTVDKEDGRTGIPILHNTYYTMLIKGGVVYVIIFILFLLLNIRIAYRLLKNEKYFFEGIILFCLIGYLIVDGYIVRAMMQKGEDIAPYLMIGWANALYCRKGLEPVEEETDEDQ